MTYSLPSDRTAGFLKACPPPILSNGSVLLIGPNDDSRETLKVVLELWNYKVVEAERAEDLARIARDLRPSIILIDTPLLFDDTLHALSKLHSGDCFGTTPSVVLSGNFEASYRKEAWRRGATCFLTKPIDFDILRKYVDTLIGKNSAYKAPESRH